MRPKTSEELQTFQFPCKLVSGAGSRTSDRAQNCGHRPESLVIFDGVFPAGTVLPPSQWRIQCQLLCTGIGHRMRCPGNNTEALIRSRPLEKEVSPSENVSLLCIITATLKHYLICSL